MTDDEFYDLNEQLLIDIKELKTMGKMHEGMTDLLMNEFKLFEIILKKVKTSIASDAKANNEKCKKIQGLILNKIFPEQNKLRNALKSLNALGNEIDPYNAHCIYDQSQLEVHLDYLERAEQLVRDGNKDAAHIIIGSTLNLCLRDLSDLNNIELKYVDSRGVLMNKSSELLYTDLVKNGCILPEDEDMILNWVLLINDDERWKAGAFSEDEVFDMVRVMKEFLVTEIKMEITE